MFDVPRWLRLAGLATAAIAAAAAQPAFGAETTSNLGVSATVTANCVVSTSPIAFGNVDVTTGSNVDGTGGLSVTCTTGTIWSATADAGAGIGASNTTRKMASGLNALNYALYTNAGRTIVWGDGLLDGLAISGTGTGAAQANTIYGRIPAGQTSARAGSYADTVTVTVTY